MPDALANLCCGTAQRAGPGRPRDPAKEDAIVNAARAAFFERGVNASTIEDIAARAGVSKVTLYNRFGDKETLFEAVIRAEITRMAAAFDVSATGEKSFEQQLNGFGRALLGTMFDAEHVVFERMLSQEIAQSPALSERFFRAGPALCRSRLAGILTEAADRGEIAVEDPIAAAEDLVSLWKGFGDIELKFGLIAEASDAYLWARAERGTRTFLRAYAPARTEGAAK